MHNMNVQPKYYNLLKSGQKTIELRLLDERRRAIKIGDEIIFTNASDTTDCFTAQVVDLYFAATFADLCDQIAPSAAGFESASELVSVLETFYPLQKQCNTSVVGICIKKY